MVSASRCIGVLAGGFLLCLGLSNCQSTAAPAHDKAWAAHAMKFPQSDRRTGTESTKREVRRGEGQNNVLAP